MMTRYSDNDYDDVDYADLHLGRWERNTRATLKSKRGRKALAELREALLALPEKRLIDSAVCTVGGVDQRLPAMTDEAFRGQWTYLNREDKRDHLAAMIGRQGEGVCAIGAYLWHRKVKAGADPAEAFASLPTVLGSDDSDALSETAKLAEREAGMAYTLAWNLAYRNDETYERMTPEERYAAFLAWIDQQLGGEA